MTAPTCLRCGQPLADGSAICHSEALTLADRLHRAAGHAEDAWTVIARQARYGSASRGGQSEPLPLDLTASTRFAAASNTIGGWMRILLEETDADEPEAWRPTAGPVCGPRRPVDGEPDPGQPWHPCTHLSCATIRAPRPSALAEACTWLAAQVERLRRHLAAAEAFDDLDRACQQLEWLVDRPPDKDLVGVCDCGKVLYAERGKEYAVCPEKTCAMRWHVERSREILRRHLDDKLVTAAEAARLAAFLDTDRTQEQIRKLANKWAERGRITPHGLVDGEHTYRFGDIAIELARAPRREQRRDGAAA